MLSLLKRRIGQRIDSAVQAAMSAVASRLEASLTDTIRQTVQQEVRKFAASEECADLIRSRIEAAVIANVRVQDEVRRASLLRGQVLERLYAPGDGQKIL